MNIENLRWLKPAQAAIMMSTSKKSIYRMLALGSLPGAVKVKHLGWRIDKHRLEEYLCENAVRTVEEQLEN